MWVQGTPDQITALLDEELAHDVSIRNEQITTNILDFGEEERPIGQTNYAELRSGSIEVRGQRVRTAPVATVDGRSAAQFMIITGCDDGRFGNMPDYLSNLSLACLIQDTSEKLYPGLARPVLFDYRNYNQHISTGSLLIEVGSHANSLDEAVYTGELLGEILSDSLSQLAAPAGNSDAPEVS